MIVRAPIRISDGRIKEFVFSKSDWILAQQKKAASRQAPVHTFLNGDTFLFLGKLYPLQISDNSSKSLRLDTCFHLRSSDQPLARKVFMNWYKQHARRIFTERVQYFANLYHFSYSKIKLSSARTRWGSCNSKGSLSFTWRLVMAPMEIIDYVVIHELVHLEIPNHSPAFWKKVEDLLPDYKKRRAWLKVNGHSLNLGN